MNDKFVNDVLNEIDERYIDEAVRIQQKRGSRVSIKRFAIPLVAGIALILVAGVILFPNNRFYDQTIELIESEIENHSFSLVVYAAEDSEHTEKETPEESHEYIISSNNGKIANKIYILTSVNEMAEEMKNRIDLAEEMVMCFGFNMSIEGEGIQSITYETEDAEFAKKIEYNWHQDKELFKRYPDCLGVASKEYYEGCKGIAYENCGKKENKHWIMVPAGKSYTVPYEKQGDSEYLYALKLIYERKVIEEAQEYSRLNVEDNYQTINKILASEVLGKKIKLTINYVDGCKEEMVVEIIYTGGRYMKVQIKEITKNYNDFEDIMESLNEENGTFYLKKLERTKNGWKVSYRNFP